MKVIHQEAYGSPDTLDLRDVDRPVVGHGEALLHVHAASAHIRDWHVMTGLPYPIRIVVPDLGISGTPDRPEHYRR
jgi:NADPH:quinone reductase-like Zn-dependent oxidoreductase